jgi:ATP-binding cassette subfamily B protein
MIAMLKNLWVYIPNSRRRHFFLLLLLMIFVSIAEVISIGSVIPFLGAVTDPNALLNNPHVREFAGRFNINSGSDLLIPLLIGFCATTLLAGFSRILLLAYGNKLSFATGSDLSIEIYRKTLYQPYISHISKNSSEIINGVSTKANGITYGVLLPIITLISSVIILLGVMSFLIFFNPLISLIAFFGFGSLYASVAIITSKNKKQNSTIIAKQSTKLIKCLQEGLGGIRDIIIDGSQDVYCKSYLDADRSLRNAQSKNQFLTQSPRYYVESIGMLFIAGLAYLVATQPMNYTSPILLLGVLALAAQRMLPILQQVYASVSLLQSTYTSLGDVLQLLNQPVPNYVGNNSAEKKIAYKEEISLCNVSFVYSKALVPVLQNINLKIQKGDRIGFIGPTGCGKSTLMDLIMGLLEPTSGELKIDGYSINGENKNLWHPLISHVPQSIYLSDSTIAENIAFGIPKNLIDFERVIESAKAADISGAIESFPQGYQTCVGERGVRLSGGQRQRIGLARALYKRADVIILDEATSALDEKTENKVMMGIDKLSKELTILIVAHRLTTLKNCTKIVKIKSGQIESICKYTDII